MTHVKVTHVKVIHVNVIYVNNHRGQWLFVITRKTMLTRKIDTHTVCMYIHMYLIYTHGIHVYTHVYMYKIYTHGRGGGLGSSTIFKNLMSPTPRRK